MNKLVIIGNGFDLAHGLPTSYGDFINWYWEDLFSKIEIKERFEYEDENLQIKLRFHSFGFRGKTIRDNFSKVVTYKSFKEFLKPHISRTIISIRSSDGIDSNRKASDDCSLKIKNDFLKLINEKHQVQNWVDIENEYYKLLKECLKEEDSAKVKKLNEEFEQVKNLLERYLKEEVETKYDFDKPNEFYKTILDNFLVKPLGLRFTPNGYLEEFPKKDHKQIIEIDNLVENSTNKGSLEDIMVAGRFPVKNLFINFNYTYSLDFYIDAMKKPSSISNFYVDGSQIQIHGRLNDPGNKINFGFGDEMDNHYQQIEEKDDNEYLKYIKSFQYLQNSNYKKVLDYIESDIFQVYIMGHSCGLSDRILLNTIFEHTNCVSIKVFYYKNGNWDNYTEIVQNISRHFNKKKMMRDKIVNKSLCVPLPQDIRFEKK
jgi:hypothetical protein